jgi:hypothetical protein
VNKAATKVFKVGEGASVLERLNVQGMDLVDVSSLGDDVFSANLRMRLKERSAGTAERTVLVGLHFRAHQEGTDPNHRKIDECSADGVASGGTTPAPSLRYTPPRRPFPANANADLVCPAGYVAGGILNYNSKSAALGSINGTHLVDNYFQLGCGRLDGLELANAPLSTTWIGSAPVWNPPPPNGVAAPAPPITSYDPPPYTGMVLCPPQNHLIGLRIWSDGSSGYGTASGHGQARCDASNVSTGKAWSCQWTSHPTSYGSGFGNDGFANRAECPPGYPYLGGIWFRRPTEIGNCWGNCMNQLTLDLLCCRG